MNNIHRIPYFSFGSLDYYMQHAFLDFGLHYSSKSCNQLYTLWLDSSPIGNSKNSPSGPVILKIKWEVSFFYY